MAKLVRYCNGVSGALCLLSLIAFISGLGSLAQAQTGSPPPQEMIIHPDGVVDVKTLPPPGPEAPGESAVPFRVPDPEALQQLKAQLQTDSSNVPGSSLPGAPGLTPSVQQNFIGLRKSESGNFIPPDTQVAAGPGHVFEVVNVEGRIFTKTGTPVSTFTLSTFFNAPGILLSDPLVRFDPATQRWFVAMITVEDGGSRWLLAVSTTSDPTGSFVRYSVTTPSSLPDYPNMGISDDKVILTANAFACGIGCSGTFQGTEFIVFNKAQLVAGATTNTAFFPPPQGKFTLRAAQSLSATTTLFMAAADFNSSTSMRIWSVNGIPGVGGGVTLTTVDRTINSLVTPPAAVQKGTSRLIETNDNRLLDAVFRNGSLWVSATSACIPSGDSITRACLRFIEVLTGSLTVNQDFNFGTPQTYYYYPAIQTDSANNLITVFSRSSASEFASVYASGRLASEPPNTLQAPVLIHAGEAPYQPFADRWGDYSGAGIDPSDQTTVWVAGEYTRVEGVSEWGTWIAQLRLAQASASVVCDMQLNKTTFVTGDAVIAQILRIANPGAIEVPVELKIWIEAPGLAPISFVNIGADGSVKLPPGFTTNAGPLTLFTFAAAFPHGTYGFNCRALQSATGGILAEDLNAFTFP